MRYRHAHAAGSDEDQLAASCFELREGSARQTQRTGNLELPLRLDCGVALLQQRAVGAPAGIIDHDVDTPEGAHRRLDDSCGRCGRGDVGGNHFAAAAGLANRSRDLFEAAGAARVDH